jgi:hypothetical protein
MAALGGMALLPTACLGDVQTKPTWLLEGWNPNAPFLAWGKTLRIQPLLMYATPQKKEKSSWRSWGGVLSDDAAEEEAGRISQELNSLAGKAGCPIEFLAVKKIKSPEEASQAVQGEFDAVLLYPASGSGKTMQACVSPGKDLLIFVRHRSGPVYYWYEALSVAYLKTDKPDADKSAPPLLGSTHVDDVTVDDYDDLAWKLRALYGVKNLTGTKIIALGGDWGKYAGDAPLIAREKHKMEIVPIAYSDVSARIKSALADPARKSQAIKWAEEYLAMPQTTLRTEKTFVVNAFILYSLFKELMRENQTPVFTIKECMSIIIPIAETTACLTLGLLNDEGLLTFCESDFVVIPAGILLRHLTGKPVFMHNSTFPHKAIVTCAHCSAPRRMNSVRYEPTAIVTHEESDYGAAPKVEIPIGQELSFIDPEYTKGRWVGLRGNVADNPNLPICRSQQDVRVQGKWQKLLGEVRDSHWLMVYGSYLKESGFAARKMGIRWENISDAD